MTGKGNDSNRLTLAYSQSTVFLLLPLRHCRHRALSSPSATTVVQTTIAAVGINEDSSSSSCAAAACLCFCMKKRLSFVLHVDLTKLEQQNVLF
jgi:hypothetical protein